MNQNFQVQGMTCGHCERAVTQAVQRIDPAAHCTSSGVDVQAPVLGEGAPAKAGAAAARQMNAVATPGVRCLPRISNLARGNHPCKSTNFRDEVQPPENGRRPVCARSTSVVLAGVLSGRHSRRVARRRGPAYPARAICPSSNCER